MLVKNAFKFYVNKTVLFTLKLVTIQFSSNSSSLHAHCQLLSYEQQHNINLNKKLLNRYIKLTITI